MFDRSKFLSVTLTDGMIDAMPATVGQSDDAIGDERNDRKISIGKVSRQLRSVGPTIDEMVGRGYR
jgi:hypothetical protein